MWTVMRQRRRVENEPQTLPPPRRKRRFGRYALFVLFATCAFFGWREYTFRKAIREIKAAGFTWHYDDPIEIIRDDWRAIFRRKTWTIEEREIYIESAWAVIAEHREAIERLRPLRLMLISATGPTRWEVVQNLSSLRTLVVIDCEELKSVAGMEALTGLEQLHLCASHALENVDALKRLTGLKVLSFQLCSALTRDAIAALKAALPNTEIINHDDPASPPVRVIMRSRPRTP